VVRCVLAGKTRNEAATELRCAAGTVASRLARGRALLADRLMRRGVILPTGELVSLHVSAAMAMEKGTDTNPPRCDLLGHVDGARKGHQISRPFCWEENVSAAKLRPLFCCSSWCGFVIDQYGNHARRETVGTSDFQEQVWPPRPVLAKLTRIRLRRRLAKGRQSGVPYPALHLQVPSDFHSLAQFHSHVLPEWAERLPATG